MQKTTLTAANDNPGGTTTVDAALLGLVDLLAMVEATGLKGIMRAVEQGAPYATFHDRAEQLSKEIKTLQGRIDAIENARAAPLPASSRAIYAEVLDRMEHLLCDPEVRLEAHEHLTTIIREVRLRLDPKAPESKLPRSWRISAVCFLGRVIPATSQIVSHGTRK